MDQFIVANAKPTTAAAVAKGAANPAMNKTSSVNSDKSSNGSASYPGTSAVNSIFGPRASHPRHMPPVTVQRSTNHLYMRKNNENSSSDQSGSSPPGFNNGPAQQQRLTMANKMSMMQISELKSEKFSAPNSIIKDRFFNSSGHVTGYQYQPRNALYNGSNRLANYDRELEAHKQQQQVAAATALNGVMNRNSMHSQFTNQYNHHPAHHHQNYVQPPLNVVQPQPTADTKAMQALQQIQEAKPGNKRAILTDLPEYLYSIPALASFFEPYGEVAMLQILPLKRMWDGDLIDLLGASMCSRLGQNTYCAIVEFYSARMAKFIIGILRKRLPILKFRCALLKPSAAIELTNQADNLGLSGAVRLRHIPEQKTKSADGCNASSSGQGSSTGQHEEHDASSTSSCSPSPDATKAGLRNAVVAVPVVAADNASDSPVGGSSENESGLDEMASSRSASARQPANSHHLPTSSSCSVSDDSETTAAAQQQASHSTENAAANAQLVNGQRFVASLNIQLNR